MNYRHQFHAGNFADLVKHVALLAALQALTRPGAAPLTVIDTHAGAGLYDLNGEAARKSGEAEAGIARLAAQAKVAPALHALKAAVAKANPKGGLRWYPGSPLLAARALRRGDSLVACELRAEDGQALQTALGPAKAGLQVVVGDGFETAPRRLPAKGPALLLIDPPYERPDDYTRIAPCLRAMLARNPALTALVWTPLKDLETFDRLLRGLEALNPPPTLVVETRLRPLSDPLRMNGCALVIVQPAEGVEIAADAASRWVVEALGEAGGEARAWWL